MPRPLPILPRGPRRARVRLERLLLACPWTAPDWELAALRALVKPQFKSKILHRSSRQKIARGAMADIEAAVGFVAQRLGYQPQVHFPDAGDYFFVIAVERPEYHAAMALSLLLSRRMPGVWLTFDRLYIRDGRFFRQRVGRRFELHRAAAVHLPRAIRAAVHDALRG